MTTPLPIAHVGVLVDDLETARERWSRVLGLPFSPITRYQPDSWSDRATPEPHEQSARLTFCFGDMPSFEIIQFVGVGTHSPTKGEGGHHLSFPPVENLAARRDEIAALGVGGDGTIEFEKHLIFMFADARPLDNVYTEWVEEHPAHADVKDDGSPINRRADGSKTLFDLDMIDAVEGIRPFSGVTEVEVAVESLPRAAAIWSALTGYSFPELQPDHITTLSTRVGQTAIRLTEFDELAGSRLGVVGAVVSVEDLGATASRLEGDDVPIVERSLDRGEVTGFSVDPAYLNNVTIHFRRAA